MLVSIGIGIIASSAKQLKPENKNTSKDTINLGCIGLIKIIMSISSSFYHCCNSYP
jgi:hypothetical protein